jgi:hypothetical protein
VKLGTGGLSLLVPLLVPLLALLVALSPTASLAAAPSQPEAPAEDAVNGFESAGELLRKCRQTSSFGRNYCFAYLAATADAARSYRVWLGSGDPCLPANLTLGSLTDIFEAYLVANPSLTSAQAASVMVAALQEAFPCPAPTPTPFPQKKGAAVRSK